MVPHTYSTFQPRGLLAIVRIFSLVSFLYLEIMLPPSLPVEILLIIPEAGQVSTVQICFLLFLSTLYCHSRIAYHMLTLCHHLYVIICGLTFSAYQYF